MALPDTGAEMSVLGEEFAYSMGVSVEKMQHTDTVVMTADGLPIKYFCHSNIVNR